MDNRKKGVLCIVIANVLLSYGGVLIKSVDASSMTIAAVRGGIAGIVFIPFIQWKKLRFDKSFVGLILALILAS
ncbi:EamA family transporter [Eubacterium aggregans]|uniref:EamA family transporter n=1 Tax=Eubacterium aggregans TaxID=81409 RepID=UPI003F3069EC